jgi:hypothetical protein
VHGGDPGGEVLCVWEEGGSFTMCEVQNDMLLFQDMSEGALQTSLSILHNDRGSNGGRKTKDLWGFVISSDPNK